MGEKRSERSRGDRRRRRRRWTVGLACAGVVVSVVVGYLAYRAAADLPGAGFPDQGNRHISSETEFGAYNSDPPTSGPHLPSIAPWGVHTRPIPPQLQVHNLEDGGVLVQYSCQCPELVEKLKAIVTRYDKYVILAPYPAMKPKISVTAWTRIDTMEELDERRLTRFINAYRGIDHHK
jgi:hypothetical protein